jgi:hypothetical protein
MTRRIATAVALVVALALGAVSAFAAAPTTNGKVVSVEAGVVKIAIEGEKPAWVKKDAPVKFKDGVGKILEVSAEGTTPVVITVKTKKAASMKAGEAVPFEKGKPMAGC